MKALESQIKEMINQFNQLRMEKSQISQLTSLRQDNPLKSQRMTLSGYTDTNGVISNQFNSLRVTRKGSVEHMYDATNDNALEEDSDDANIGDDL